MPAVSMFPFYLISFILACRFMKPHGSVAFTVVLSFCDRYKLRTLPTGQRFIKVAKSPMSPAVAFPFIVESSGITLLNDEGTDVSGPEITSIRCQGTIHIVDTH